MRPSRALFALLLLLAACGDSSGSSSSSDGAASSGGEAEPEAESDTDSARTLYEEALLDFRNDNCIDAEPVFRRIRREFPYSRYSALADLRVGDCQMRSKSYAEAITTYQSFVRYRASHPLVPYARFRIAEAHFKQIPSDWFLVPPSYERDSAAAQDALRYLRRFILDYPEDERVPEALAMATRALRVLAEHELYVAHFYESRGAWPGVVFRLETLLARYDGSGLEPEALLLLGEAYHHVHADADARRAYETLLARFPEASEAGTARSRLARLPAPTEAAPAAAAPAAAAPEAADPADEPAETPPEEAEGE